MMQARGMTMIRNCIVAVAAMTMGVLLQGASAFGDDRSKAEVVYSNGGRIAVVKADGSDRRILTKPGGKDPFMGERSHVGDDSPAISPDGKSLVFLRLGWLKSNRGPSVKIMLADSNGKRQRVLWTVPAKQSIEGLKWTQDGKAVVFGAHNRSTFTHEFKRLALGEKKPKTLFEKDFDAEAAGWFGTRLSIKNFELSPNGKKLAFDFWDDGTSRIDIHDLGSGETETLVRGGTDATFSPDGRTVFFAGARKRQGCFEGCLRGGLYRVAVAGGKARRILKLRGDVESPSVAPNGGRIVFSSNRNFPLDPEVSSEIYTVKPDGSCLTWLTNGSPSSKSPDWGSTKLADPSPGRCGQADRAPLVEYRLKNPTRKFPKGYLWAGLEQDGRLLSAPMPSAWNAIEYGDCGYFDPRRCHKPLAIEMKNQCSSVAPFMAWDRTSRVTNRRGVPLTITAKDGRTRTVYLSVDRFSVFIGSAFFGDGVPVGKRNGLDDLLDVIGALRPLGSSDPTSGPLPRPLMADYARKWTQRAERLYEESGSYAEVAKKMKATPDEIRNDLAWAREVEKTGPVRTFRCGKKG